MDKIHQVEYTRAAADKALEMQASRVVPVAAAGPSLVQPTMQQTLERHKLYDVASPRKQAIDEAVIEMIVRDMQPFSVVEDKGFRNLVKTLDPRYQLPSRKTITTVSLPQLYLKERTRVSKVLKEADAVSLTTDIWTSRRTQSYITVTAHALGADWTLKSFILDTARMTEAHTARNIKTELEDIMSSWDIKDKVFAIVTDNASNMVAAVGLMDIHHIPCFAHTLNLVVIDSLKELTGFSATRKKVKAIATYFHMSVKASEELCNAQKSDGFDTPLKLINEVETRWNSTFFMLERIAKLHTSVTTALCRMEKHHMCITGEELAQINTAVLALRPFDMATREMSGEQFLTSSLIIPMVQMLKEHMNDLSGENSVAAELAKQLQKRFHCPEKRLLWSKSTYLDPRFKRHGFSEPEYVSVVEEKLLSELTPIATQNRQETSCVTTVPSADKSVASGLWSKFDARMKSVFSTATQSIAKPHMELSFYKEEDPVFRHEDPLIWWKTHCHILPQMAKLTRMYLSCPATSVPAERVFESRLASLSEKVQYWRKKH